MLVYVTPKLENELIPYSYRARATIVAPHIANCRVTDDIKSLQEGDVAVLGKKHTREDAEYCIGNEIKYIVDVADDKFEMFKHWYFTIPNANAVSTTCHALKKLIEEETQVKAHVIEDPTERKKVPPRFRKKDKMVLGYYGAISNFSKLNFLYIRDTLSKIYPTEFRILTNKPEHMPKPFKGTKVNRYWMLRDEIVEYEKKFKHQYDNMQNWSMKAQDEFYDNCDIILLPVTSDRESRCKGNNRPIDAMWSGRFVISNPGIPSYEELNDFIWCDNLADGYIKALKNPKEVKNRIKNAQEYIERERTPDKIAMKWESLYRGLL